MARLDQYYKFLACRKFIFNCFDRFIPFVGSDSGILSVPNDKGTTWQSINDGLPDYSIIGTIVSDNSVIVIGIVGNGIYKSINNGDSWSNITGNMPIYEINYDWYNIVLFGDTIIAGTQTGLLYITTNNGTNWNS